MPEKGFPLPGSSYKELIKIIQGYGEVGPNASPADVARIVSVHDTIVSRNNRFLGAIGIIQGGQKKSATPLGKELAHALQHDIQEEIIDKWRAIVDANDFLQKVVAAVRIRKGMDESSLISHVAYSAGQPKTTMVATGAGAIVDILVAAQVLKEDGGNLVATTPESAPISDGSEEPSSAKPQTRRPPSAGVAGSQLFYTMRAPANGISLNIDVRIQCSASDIDDLGLKLRNLIKQINDDQTTDQTDSPTGEHG